MILNVDLETRQVCEGGNTVIVDHGGKYYSIYAHLKDYPLVGVGDSAPGNGVCHMTLLSPSQRASTAQSD